MIKGSHHTEESKAKLRSKRKPLSEVHKTKISVANKGENNYFFGKRHTEESKQKMRETLKGRIPWNKGKKRPAFSKEWIEKIRQANTGEKGFWFGKHFSEEHRNKIKEGKKGTVLPTRGENHWNWKGGVSIKYKSRFTERKWQQIAKIIRKRDNYRCQLFGRFGFDVHHIIPFSESGKDRQENLITLCKEHHGQIDRSKFQSFWRFYLAKHIRNSLN